MKFIMSLLVMLLCVSMTSAASFELDEGAMEIGGEVTFQSASGDLYENGNGDGQTAFSLSPNGFYFIKPGLGVGGVLLFGSHSQGDYSNTVFGIGPGLIYYFGDNSTDLWPFVTGSFLYTSEKDDDGTTDMTISGTTIHLEGGIAKKLVDHYTLKAGIYFNIDSAKSDAPGAESVSGNVFGVSVGFSGFVY